MAVVELNKELCSGCLCCTTACPFGAITPTDGIVCIEPHCSGCGACVDSCPTGALVMPAITDAPQVRQGWQGYFVLLQLLPNGRLHPVSLELLGQAQRFASKTGARVCAGVVGADCQSVAAQLAGCGISELLVAQGACYRVFCSDLYATAVIALLQYCRPAVALFGATPECRQIAPLAAVHFGTGLTADCTRLDLDDTGVLGQIRPAFGGNIMAHIVTPWARPQMATVRPQVLPPIQPTGSALPAVRDCTPPPTTSAFRISKLSPHLQITNIAQCEVLVAIGKGVAAKEDIALFAELAELLGGQLASSRTLVEKGWMSPACQIGLSGQAVRPKLLLTCGVSGSVQFMAGAAGAQLLCSINSDPQARIFQYAHYGVVGDIYTLIPALIDILRGQ